jgi:hypothetical protein
VNVLGTGFLSLLEDIRPYEIYCYFHILLVLLRIIVYMDVCFVCFCLILYIMYYRYVYVFLLLRMFRSRYCLSLCCSLYCLCVNCSVLLPPGVIPIGVNKYNNINIKVHVNVKFSSTGVYIFSILFCGFAYVCACWCCVLVMRILMQISCFYSV